MDVRRPPIRFPKRPLLGAVLLGLLSCHYDRTVAPQGSLVASVVVTAPRQSLAPGDTIQLTAQVMDSNGRVLPSEPVTWSSSTPAVATVDANGRVVADSVGATTITATAAGQAGHTDLTVQSTVLCDCTEIVDSTAVRLVSRNDSTGIYVFQVLRGPPPRADSGTILVGAGSGGFLRRVLHSTLVGDLLTVETAPAYLEEAIREGEFSVTQSTDSSRTAAGAVGAGTAAGPVWFGPWTTTYLAPGVTQTSAACCSISLNGVTLALQNETTIRKVKVSEAVKVKVDSGELNFIPPLSIGGKFKYFQLQNFHVTVGSGLGLELHPYTLSVIVGVGSGGGGGGGTGDSTVDSIPRDTLPSDSTPSDTTSQDMQKRLLEAHQQFSFFIGPVPVVGVVTERVNFKVDFNADASVVFQGRFSAGYHATAGVRWTRGHGWRPVASAGSHFSAQPPKLQGIQGSASAKIAIVPEISVAFYEVAGPFINLEPYAQATAAADATFAQGRWTGFDWLTDVALGANLNMGAKLSLFGRKDIASVGFAIPLIKPRELIRDYSDGPLTVRATMTGEDTPDSVRVRLRPAFHDQLPLTGIRDLSTSNDSAWIHRTDTAGVVLDDAWSGTAHPHQLTLDRLQGNCYSTNPNPDTVAISSGLFIAVGHPATDTLFAANCIPFGHLRVRTLTSGPDAAPGYRATMQRRQDPLVGTWDHDPVQTVALRGGPAPPDTVIDSLIPVNPHNGGNGVLAVALEPGRRNCATARPDTNVVVIQSGDTVDTQFLVRCVPLGHIWLRTATTDADPPPSSDPLRYTPQVTPVVNGDAVQAQPDSLLADDSTQVDSLVPLFNASGAPGGYVVALANPPDRCVAGGGYTRSVTVLPGDTAVASFSMRCVERLQVVTRTTGPGIDPDGYQVVVDNADGAGAADTVPIGTSDTAGIAGVSPGAHTIHLAGVDPTCVAPNAQVDTVSATDSTLVRFAVSCPAPAPPTGLQATLVDTNRVALDWAAPTGSVVAFYRIYRDGVLHDSSTTPAFTDLGLSPFTPYVYQVSSVDPNGLEGVRTEPLGVRTRDATPPTAPTGLTATATSASRIALAWQAAVDSQSGVSGYVIYRDGAVIDSATALSFADTGLSGATSYAYTVAAFNGDSLQGPQSDPAGATTLDGTPPTAPPELGATAVSASEIDLSWAAASDPESGIQGYRVYRDGALVATASGTSFPDVGLQPNTPYTYTVTAVNGAGLEGPASPSATATTLADETPPPAPTGLTAIATTSTRIDLQWNPVTDPESGIRTYRVYRDGALIESSATTTLADSGLVPGETYTYEVAAVNGAGLEGARSDPASATTPSGQDGDLVVHTTTSGTGIPAEFTVQVNKDAFLETQPIAPTGTVAFNGLVPQEYHVRLINLPTSCTVADVNARKLTVVAGTTVETTFVVTCQ